MADRSQTGGIDPAFFARWCLDDELFGPDGLLTEQDAHDHVADLHRAERAEALDLLCRRRSMRQQRFRARVDRAADLWPEAAAAATSGVGVFHEMSG